MARRGFFAEIQHQSRLAAREHQRQERQATQNYLANARFAEQAKKIEMRAQAQLAKATESERKRYEKEAREAHLQAMEADVLERNGQLEEIYGEIDSLLASSLAVDDYIDLNSLRITASHGGFKSEVQHPGVQ